MYRVIRSKRKTVAMSVSKDLEVIVRAPLKYPNRYIEDFVNKNKTWIDRQIKQITEYNSSHKELSLEEIQALYSKAKDILPKKVSHYSAITGLSPTAVTITGAKTRWGSCSSKNRICFSYKVMLLPEHLLDYIVVHELAHIQIKNHSPHFYALVERFIPDYRSRIKELKAC